MLSLTVAGVFAAVAYANNVEHAPFQFVQAKRSGAMEHTLVLGAGAPETNQFRVGTFEAKTTLGSPMEFTVGRGLVNELDGTLRSRQKDAFPGGIKFWIDPVLDGTNVTNVFQGITSVTVTFINNDASSPLTIQATLDYYDFEYGEIARSSYDFGGGDTEAEITSGTPVTFSGNLPTTFDIVTSSENARISQIVITYNCQ